MDERLVQQILLARYYLHLASEQMVSPQQSSKFVAINLLHEAIEATLIACADHLNAKLPDRCTFEQYLDKIDDKLADRELPLRARILQFNRARVAAKHHLTLPNDEFIDLMGKIVPEFIRDTVLIVFDKNIDEVSLIDLVEDENLKEYLRESQIHISSGDFYESLISSRKAFYAQFEKNYDIREFKNDNKSHNKGILSPFSLCHAPYYAKNSRYIEENVRSPSEYIVLDHTRIEADLIRDGIDVHKFWNIWRLTPRVYDFNDEKWVVEHDFDIKDDEFLHEKSVYVLDNLINITIQRQKKIRSQISRSSSVRYIEVKPETKFLKKAMVDSPIVGVLPPGVHRVNIMKSVPGLDGNGTFWEASYVRKNGPWLFGFINIDETVGEPKVGLVADGIDHPDLIPGGSTTGA
ncbi:hypothetical protein [Alteraurantiacibacter aquimixticola]|uniref:Uncharacterized protein n=1 Tax=Alteraurantiacibacter aquimixticola TaxID=2489173 RepID=A0A4T3F655_9SPHN|nr:hypothetical protein [Alteraurantiacibacter aquimixticola]TIX50336.1 hypothetical protein E5222_08630 [Alteraurantiacibacter aquimixticola]